MEGETKMGTTNWTSEQLQAIQSKDSNILVAAAAGSRKNCGISWKDYPKNNKWKNRYR